MLKMVGAWKTKRGKRYAVAAAVAVLLAMWVYEFLVPLFTTPSPLIE
jgi:hypothetical protein